MNHNILKTTTNLQKPAAELAHKANILTMAYRDAVARLRAFQLWVDSYINDPMFRKVMSASKGFMMANWFLSALFCCLLPVEYAISCEAYRIFMHPLILYSLLVGLTLWASLCLGEYIEAYNLGFYHETEAMEENEVTSIIDRLYRRKSKKEKNKQQNNLLLHPRTGWIILISVLIAVYKISELRVALMQEIAPGFTDNTFLPVFFYLVEAALGIPFYLSFVHMSCTIFIFFTNRRLEKLSLEARAIKERAIELRRQYEEDLAVYNEEARQLGLPGQPEIPANRALCQLLEEEAEQEAMPTGILQPTTREADSILEDTAEARVTNDGFWPEN